jgi:hypothetical protein
MFSVSSHVLQPLVALDLQVVQHLEVFKHAPVTPGVDRQVVR